MASATATYIALERAAPFACPQQLASLSATCKTMRSATMSTLVWTPFFRRRFPCLATLENYASPSDARALVKALLTAAPVPRIPPDSLPACSRDGEGRATPLRGDVILAAQMSVRSDATLHAAYNFSTISTEWYQPFAHGAVRLAEHDLKEGIRERNWEGDGVSGYMFDVPLELAGDALFRELRHVLALPAYFELHPEQQAVVADGSIEGGGDPAEFIPRVLETFLRESRRFVRQDLYIVAGDQIWLLNTQGLAPTAGPLDDEIHMTMTCFEQFFEEPFRRLCDGHQPGGDDEAPWFPVAREIETNFGMVSEWRLGLYDHRTRWEDVPAGARQRIPFRFGLELEVKALWSDDDLFVEVFEAALADPTPDSEHECLCQLLATTRPVRFPRRQQAA